ncbi:MAG: glycoside hydrolase family 2 protein [Beijerinckiaceae bacterium]
MARVIANAGETRTPLRGGWRCVVSPADAWRSPSDIPADAHFIDAPVPGTAADALIRAGHWSFDDPIPLDERDVWYHCTFETQGAQRLVFQGLATFADIFLNGKHVASSRSMFVPLTIEANLTGRHQLDIRFHALTPFLENKGARARWRPRMIQPSGLRNIRTTALGRMPGFAPPAPPVGPWRDIDLVSDGEIRVARADIKPRLEGSTGILHASIELAQPFRGGASLTCAGETIAFRQTAPARYEVTLRIVDVAPWWPHTYGEPALHDVSARFGSTIVDLGRTGFRRIEVDRGDDERAFGIVLNGTPIFCRGAVWTPADPIGLDSTRETLAPLIARAREAGMNMLRVGGTMTYESDAFFELCDETGILVWHDFMFANFDYPIGNPDFRTLVEQEARFFLDRSQASPALAIVCGGSEVYQQAAMLGVPESRWRSPLFDELLPALVRKMRPDCTYVENSPSRGALPFHANAGVSHYYGVGAYRRPLEDTRRTNVRFACECLGFANVPNAASVARDFGAYPLAGGLWDARIPRDAGASQDFEQVRDHYVADLYGIDSQALRATNPLAYLNFGRATVAEAMEATFAEWRRAGSPTRGGLVWFFKDLWPSSGWGVLDWQGEPKSAWYALRRAFRPVQLVISDEGVNGLALYLINESAAAIEAVITLECFKDGAISVMRGRRQVRLEPRSATAISDVDLLGGFFDTTYAYRFGPPPHDVTVARLVDATGQVVAEAFHFPLGRAALPPSPALDVALQEDARGWLLRLATKSFAQSVRIEDAQFRPDDDWFHLAPGADKIVRLRPRTDFAAAAPCGLVAPLFGEPTAYGRLP